MQGDEVPMVRGTVSVTSTRPNIFYLQSLNPLKLGNSLELGEGKKFRDFGRQQWAQVDIGPAAQCAAKGKHGFIGIGLIALTLGFFSML